MNCATVGIYKARVEVLLKQHAYVGILDQSTGRWRDFPYLVFLFLFK